MNTEDRLALFTTKDLLLIFNSLSIIIIFGEYFSKPFIRQDSLGLSELMVL